MGWWYFVPLLITVMASLWLLLGPKEKESGGRRMTNGERWGFGLGIVGIILTCMASAYFIGSSVGKLEAQLPEKLIERVATLENEVKHFVLVDYAAYRERVSRLYETMKEIARDDEKALFGKEETWRLLLMDPGLFKKTPPYKNLSVFMVKPHIIIEIDRLDAMKRDIDARASILRPPK